MIRCVRQLAVLSGVLLVVATANAQGEPVIELGETVEGMLEYGDEQLDSYEYVDFYSFTAEAGQAISIRLSSTAFDTYLLIRTGFGFMEDNDDIEPGNFNSGLDVTLPMAGSYLIGATSYSAGETGSYTLLITGPGGVIPERVDTIEIGQTLEGLLEIDDDTRESGEFVDSYVLNAEAGQAIVLTMTSEEFDTYLAVVGPEDFMEFNDDSLGMGTDSQLSFIAPATGELTVMATSYAIDMVGAYTLAAELTQAADVAPTLPSLTPGATVADSLEEGDETLQSGELVDLYRFVGRAGQQLEISMSSNEFDAYLILRGTDFTVDNNNMSETDYNSLLHATLPVDGEYLIGATCYRPGETGAYELTLVETGLVEFAERTIETGLVMESALTELDPMRRGGQYYHSYTFNGEAGQRATIEMLSDTIDTYVLLRGPDGFEETHDDIDYEAGNTNSLLEITLPTSGAYEILTSTYWSAEMGPYSVSLTLVEERRPDDVIPEPSEDEAVGLDIPIAGVLDDEDETLDSGEFIDWHHFAAGAAQTYTFTLESDEFDTWLIVNGPGFSEQNDDGPTMGYNSQLEGTFDTDGEVVIGVTSFSPGEIGAYSLTITEGTALAAAATGQIYGIFVGITDYTRANDLAYCAEDAVKLQQTLAETQLLADGSIVLTDSEATVANVQAAFENVAAQAGPDDVFIFFFSGHGDQPVGAAAGEPDNLNETICLHDADVTDDQMATWFDQINTRVAMIALDSCFSGGFARDVIAAPNRIGIFSSEEDVISLVAARFESGGYLSHFLRTAFTGEADNDPADGYLTVGELTQYLRRQWAEQLLSVETETADAARTYQNLVVERGGVKVTDILVYPGN